MGGEMQSTPPSARPLMAATSSSVSAITRIGVCSQRLRRRMRAAVSNPPISAMCTSRSTTAKSSFNRKRSASRPSAPGPHFDRGC